MDVNSLVNPLITLFTVLGAGGGLFATVRAWFDYREGVAARESDADDKFNKRLDERLAKTEQRIELLEAQLAAEKNYTSLLVLSLVSNGLQIPERN